MPILPEVPPDQVVLAVHQAPDPPVETRRYTMEFMNHNCTDPHNTHSSDTRPELLHKLNGIFPVEVSNVWLYLDMNWLCAVSYTVHSFLSRPDCRTKLCWQCIQLFCTAWPWLCSSLPAHNIHFIWQKLVRKDQNVWLDWIITYPQTGRQFQCDMSVAMM